MKVDTSMHKRTTLYGYQASEHESSSQGWRKWKREEERGLRRPIPFFLPIILVIIIIFFFMGEKVSSGIWETCPKILGGYEYQNPPKWGLIYIYIKLYVSQYNLTFIEKYIVNQKILMNKMCLEFDFTYDMQISLQSVNPLSY